MPCNCGKSRPKEALTSAAATALLENNLQGYKVTDPNGNESMHDQYIDAKIEAQRNGGHLREVRG